MQKPLISRTLLTSFTLSICLALSGCGPEKTIPSPNVSDAGPQNESDQDQDGISDGDEGIDSQIDTDADGTPDYLDEDSDGDGHLDRDEAGDSDLQSPPFDEDRDGTPDYLDLDADNDGILDADADDSDHDADGKPNYRDFDDDNDGLPDHVELEHGRTDEDSDGDGLPNIVDPDSDNDTILDGHEGDHDFDSDDIPNHLDDDSDNDGLFDIEEAGDDDLQTLPFDSDNDGRVDSLDLDSDSDGLSDEQELSANTNPTSADSDDDGVSDLVEVGAGTDANNANDNPQARGNFVFVVPFEEAPTPSRDTLDFKTNLKKVDVYFSFDTTGSMRQELDTMRREVPRIIDELECGQGERPETHECIPEIHTGIGIWNDAHTFRNLTSIQPDATLTASYIPVTEIGGDESPPLAALCVANPDYCRNSNKKCATSGVGCPGYREDAVKILVQITDADIQCCSRQFTTEFAGRKLKEKDIKFVSLVGTDDDNGFGTPLSVAQEIGRHSETFDRNGNPIAILAEDSSVANKTVEAIKTLSNSVFDVKLIATEAPGDDGDALRFIERVEVNTSDRGQCTFVQAVEDSNGDGFNDAFSKLTPGTPVCWDVIPRRNVAQEPSSSPLLYKAKLSVRLSSAEVDSRDVYFLVPPKIESPTIE